MAAQIIRDRDAMSGWTLIELAISIALVAVLASLSYPSLRSIILRIHRSDALTTLSAVQLHQSRYRSNNPAFATLAQLGIAETSPAGRYRLREQLPSETGFAVMAVAEGRQAADLPCSHMLLEVTGVDTRWASGPDAGVGNDADTNRRCWGR